MQGGGLFHRLDKLPHIVLILVCIGVHKKWEMVDVCSQGKMKRGEILMQILFPPHHHISCLLNNSLAVLRGGRMVGNTWDTICYFCNDRLTDKVFLEARPKRASTPITPLSIPYLTTDSPKLILMDSLYHTNRQH